MFVRAVFFSALLVLAGCTQDERKPLLVSPPPFGTTPKAPEVRLVSHTPTASEEVGKRVIKVGNKVVSANPQMCLRPAFLTAGLPKPEVFHRVSGHGFRHCEVVVTEGLVRQCRTDGQLAAVLALELGKVVSEREAMVPARVRQPDRRPPPEVRIGGDAGGTFGPADGTRYAELAKMDNERRRPDTPPPPPPAPTALAREYLKKAGYDPADLSDVTPLLRKAEDNSALEMQLRNAGPLGQGPQMPVR
jgi:hypothetical protein